MSSTLRIIQQKTIYNYSIVNVRYEYSKEPIEVDINLPPLLTPEDEEGVRWYLEEYLQFPSNPAPIIAAKIEQRIQELGLLYSIQFSGK
jgi:hypothetical protein